MSKIIHVLNKRVELAQPEDGFCTCIDAVLLAAACPAKAGESILDLGCGLGSAAFCALKRVEGTTLTGIDILPEVIELARHNALLNKMKERTHFKCIDIRDFPDMLPPCKRGSDSVQKKYPRFRGEDTIFRFDHVICNPPFMDAGEHTPSPSPARATAIGFGEDDMDLKDWVDCAFRSIKGTGSLTIIHRADAVDEIIRAMGKRFGASEIIPLWPKEGREAKRVIVRTWKHRKSPARIRPGIVLHREDGDYTDEAEKILRDMQAIA
ncbi:MAG: methyltransferase [Alphaproteobacteria bacterium]